MRSSNTYLQRGLTYGAKHILRNNMKAYKALPDALQCFPVQYPITHVHGEGIKHFCPYLNLQASIF